MCIRISGQFIILNSTFIFLSLSLSYNSTPREICITDRFEISIFTNLHALSLLHRFPGIRYRTPDVHLLVEYIARKNQVRENNLPVGGRMANRPPISSRSPRALSASFSTSVAYRAVCAFNACTICIISSRKSRKARHRRDRPACSRTTLG